VTSRDRPGPVSWSDASDFPSIDGKVVDYESGISAEVVKRGKHRLARKAFNIAKGYIDGDLQLVVRLAVPLDEHDRELVLRSVPSVIRDDDAADAGSGQLVSGRARGRADRDPVFVGACQLAKSVNCVVAAGVVVPSSVWLEPVQRRPELRRDLFPPVREIEGVFRPREVNVSSGRATLNNRDGGEHRLVDAMPNVADEPKRQPPPSLGRRLGKADFEGLISSLRIDLTEHLAMIVSEISAAAPLQPVQVVVCPAE
jgi:hypothetical protein